MTDLEKRVKELRNKYEGPIRKYLDAEKTLHDAIQRAPFTGDTLDKLIELDDRLFPVEAAIASRCAISAMNYIDRNRDDFDVWKKHLVDEIEIWKTAMEKIEI